MARAATSIPRASALRTTLPHPSRRAVAIALLAIAVLIPATFWLRDSPLVAVDDVQVSGVREGDAAAIGKALRDAADGMSTLAIDHDRLRDAVAPFPLVGSIDVERDLPHTLRIVVHERVPVGALSHDSRRVAVAGDGTILSDASAVGLPLVPVATPPSGDRVVDRRTGNLVALLGAAPATMRERVARVSVGPEGLTAQLVRGPQLYFGPATRLEAKWIAAARVLESKSSHGARYIQLRVPERPAAGGIATSNPQAEVEAPA